MNPLRWIADLWWGTHEECVDRDAGWDYKPLVVFLSACVLLTVHEYFGDRNFRYVDFLPQGLRTRPDWRLWELAWWSGSRVLLFLIVPSAIVLAMPGERLRDYGWSLRGAGRRLGAFVALACVVPILHHSLALEGHWLTPTLTVAQKSPRQLVLWSTLVAAQIVAVEFFFRGFMLQATRRSLGVHAVLAMVVPWCMFHYEKGQNVGLLAIVSGLFLGTVALRTRSIWPGVFTQAVSVVIVLELWRLR